MSTLISRALHRLFPPAESKTLILGLDAAGKTTLLYRLKLGEIVTTIPTIGFNVETVDIITRKEILTLTCWDVGGCDKIRPLIRHYFGGLKGMVWVVDSNDRERLPESIEELRRMLDDMVANSDVSPSAPVVILANKQDLPNVMTVQEVRDKFAAVLGRRANWAVYPVTCIKPLPDGGLIDAFGWFAAALKTPQAGGVLSEALKPAQAPARLPNDRTALTEKLESYLTRAETDSSPEEFLKQFREVRLPSWDHYTHIRLAFIILTTYGRQKGKNMIFDGIEHYIATSSQTTGRTFHVTMTYFWVQMVHFGIRSMPFTTPKASEDSKIDEVTAEDFHRFLLLSPHVVDGNLWADYYSKGLIMTPKAKAEMVLPDIKPLPNVVSRVYIRGPKR